MYLSHFRLKRDPFHITPDPYFFYLSPSHKEAFASMIYGLKKRKGFVAVIGEVGLGKTTVLRAFIDQRGSQQKIKTIFVFNANVSFKGLLKIIYAELGYALPGQGVYENRTVELLQDIGEDDIPSDEIFDIVQHLHTKLIQEYQEGFNIILVIDEAQNMPLDTLENLRMLSNLETAQDKLIQIFLIGQPELERTLNRKELRQLKQRIAIRSILKPLTKAESIDYIQHRLNRAGAQDTGIFTSSALRKVSALSRGTPRKINILCDNALITGFGYGKQKITSKIIKEVNEDLEGRAFHRNRKRTLLKTGAFALGFVLLGVALLQIPGIKERVVELAASTPVLKKGLVMFGQWSQAPPMEAPPNGVPSPTGPDPSSAPISNASRPMERPQQENLDLAEKGALLQNGTEPAVKQPERLDSHQNWAGHSSTVDAKPNSNQTDPGNQTAPPPLSQTHETLSSAPLEPDVRARVNSTAKESVDPGLPEIDYDTLFVAAELKKALPFFSDLSQVRQRVLIEMAKQTSIKGLLTFRRMIAALRNEDYTSASQEMVFSQWGDAMGDRAVALADVMRTEDQEDLEQWMEGG